MNAPVFYVAVGLMLGGGLMLLAGSGSRRQVFSLGAVVAGFAVLAAGLDAWPLFFFSLLFFPALLPVPFLRRRRSALPDNPARTVQAVPVEVDEEGEDEDNAVSPLRRGAAALLCAALAGILLSVVWSNPLWKIKTPSGNDPLLPGNGVFLLSVLFVLILLLTIRIRKTTADSHRPFGENNRNSER